MLDPFSVFLQFRFPNANYSIATFGKVGVLPPVDGSSSSLTNGRLGIESRVCVPIVTVELDHKRSGVDDSVNSHLSADGYLTIVGESQVVKESVTDSLQCVRLQSGLIGSLFKETAQEVRAVVSAHDRTVGGVIVFLSGWGPLKVVAAHFVGVMVLVSTHPSMLAIPRAKSGFRSRRRDVEGSRADLAILFQPVSSVKVTTAPGARRLVGTSGSRLPVPTANATHIFGQARGNALACPAAKAGRSSAGHVK